MTHHLTNDQLNSYLHQTLADAEREALDRHLADCPACRARLDGHEALQRRIRYELATELRGVQPSSRMNYAIIAPRLKRSRRFTLVLEQSHQFVYGALTLVLLVAVGAGLYLFVNNLSQPTPMTPEKVKQPTTVSTTEISQPEANPTAEVSPVELALSITGDPNPLSAPTSLAVDPQGNLYVIDAGNARIQKFDRTGQFVTMWGKPGSGEGEFGFTLRGSAWYGGIAVDRQGQVYVADAANRRIQKFDSNGRFLAKWDSRGTGDGQFIHPTDVAVDGEGYVYVVDDQRNDIQKFDSDGQFLVKWGSLGSADGQLRQPYGLAVDREGHVYVVDPGNYRVQKFDNQGQFLANLGPVSKEANQVSYLKKLGVDEQGNVYLADLNNSRVQQVDSNGQFLARWGSTGAGEAQFSQPADVAVDGEGNVYVSDYGNDRIQKFRQR